ncbi:MAG: 2OG-Fe(II) oxygenase [Hyphomicrobiales bacterium]
MGACTMSCKTTEFNPDIRVVEELRQDDIIDLELGNIVGIRIPGYYDKKLSQEAATNVINQLDLEAYEVAPDIGKFGMAIFDVSSDRAKMFEYYRRAPVDLKRLRQFFAPYLAPMDKVRLELQEIWPGGSLLERLHGQTMFCGLVRVFGEGSEARPHQDMAHWDVPESIPAHTLKTQFAMNIYLSSAEGGGDLELWNYGLSNKAQYDATKEPGDYGLSRSKIGPSSAKVKPKTGDLIIFDAQRIHAVSKITEGVRIAVSGFIGYRGASLPLTTFS